MEYWNDGKERLQVTSSKLNELKYPKNPSNSTNPINPTNPINSGKPKNSDYDLFKNDDYIDIINLTVVSVYLNLYRI
jgi:hypothetical protein